MSRTIKRTKQLPGFGNAYQVSSDSYSGDSVNSMLGAFVTSHAKEFDPDSDSYDKPAFDRAITTTKATAIYNMHTYWSKKPHDAICQYIRHYTNKGDIVLDPFCGSGGTILAAALESRVGIAIDRSPAATFITKNYCTPIDESAVEEALADVEAKAGKEIDWLYETRCDRCSGPATISYTVYSQVFQCKRCLKKVALYDCIEADATTLSGKAKKVRACPHCFEDDRVEVIRSQGEKFGFIPVVVSYICLGKCKPKRGNRYHLDENDQARKYFHEIDLSKIAEIERGQIPYWFPSGFDMSGFSRYQRDALFYYGVKEVADLYTKRNLWAISVVRHYVNLVSDDNVRDFLLFSLNAALLGVSRMVRASNTATMPGTYYIPQVSKEVQVFNSFKSKTTVAMKGQKAIHFDELPRFLVSTQSATEMPQIPSQSVDYIFTDPP